MFGIKNTLLLISNSAVERLSQVSPLAIAATLVAATAIGCYLRRKTENGDVKSLKYLARQIQELKPAIGDGASYPFVAAHKKYIPEHHTKAGTNSMLAVGLRAHANGQAYGKSPKNVLELGQALLVSRSGQCDHMAAAVVAKVVVHLKKGDKWNSKWKWWAMAAIPTSSLAARATCNNLRLGEIKQYSSTAG